MIFLMWFLFILFGFIFGSVLFSKIIPNLISGKNICDLSDDGNPGAANVFINCGPLVGMICLLLDMLKGFLPVFTALYFLDTDSLFFSLVMLAPVLGHAIGLFNNFEGGKCISTSFGVVLGIMPISMIGFLLAIIFIVFSTIIKIKPNSRRSIITFALFAIGALIILGIYQKYSIALGCLFISLVAIAKHIKSPNQVKHENITNEEREIVGKV